MKTQYNEIFTKFEKVKEYFRKNPNNGRKLIKLMIKIDRFVPENSLLFKSNKTIFHLLWKFGLIRKVLIPYGKHKRLAWKPDEKIENFNNHLTKKYGYIFNEIILELYNHKFLEKSIDGIKISKESPEIKTLENLLFSQSVWTEIIGTRIRKSIDVHKNLEVGQEDTEDFINKTKDSMMPLLESILQILGFKIENSDFKDIDTKFMQIWIKQ